MPVARCADLSSLPLAVDHLDREEDVFRVCMDGPFEPVGLEVASGFLLQVRYKLGSAPDPGRICVAGRRDFEACAAFGRPGPSFVGTGPAASSESFGKALVSERTSAPRLSISSGRSLRSRRSLLHACSDFRPGCRAVATQGKWECSFQCVSHLLERHIVGADESGGSVCQ
jgi:hypothetical protein